jgi:hypothetical protein
MLESAIAAYVCLLLVDAVGAALVLAGAAFAWHQWFIYPAGGTAPGIYWAVWPVGAALALGARLLGGHVRVAWIADPRTTPAQAIVVVFLILAGTFYADSIEDPGAALAAPFAIGVLAAWLLDAYILAAADIGAYFAGTTVHPFLLRGRHALAWYGTTALMAIDLLAWRNGWLTVVAAAAGVVALVLIAAATRTVLGARPRPLFVYTTGQ